MSQTKAVQFGNIQLGTGMPKIAVPITGKSSDEIIQQAEKIIPEKPDLVEWRIDFFNDVTDSDKLKSIAEKLRSTLNVPLLTTFRTHGEGGELELSDEKYFEICHNIISFGQTDGVDIELYHESNSVLSLLVAAKEQGIVSIMSNHDFEKTPDQIDIENRLTKMSEMGADVAKMAVMPETTADVLTLLEATNNVQNKLTTPIITMSMGDLGKVTRISGEVFGSAVTFATVGAASAPGQIPINNLRNDLNDLKLK